MTYLRTNGDEVFPKLIGTTLATWRIRVNTYTENVNDFHAHIPMCGYNSPIYKCKV